MGVYRNIIFILLLCLLLIISYLLLLCGRSSTVYVEREWQHTTDETIQLQNDARSSTVNNKVTMPQTKYLSYQPPGNGWNNQRIVIEMAMIMAKLLNRTLILHPLSSHSVSERMKQYLPTNGRFGYLTYNKMSHANLLPLSYFMDIQTMSQLLPVIEFNSTHSSFLRQYSNLSWHHICHSMGYGYWVDRRPKTHQDNIYLSKQVYVLSDGWKDKCPDEEKELKLNDNKPLVRYLSDLINDTSDMIYFEQGCLFGIQIRFLNLPDAIHAQEWIKEYFRYRQHTQTLANTVRQQLGVYNAVHIRRVKHISKQLAPGYWIVEMLNKEFTKDTPIYISTDEPHLNWFDPFTEAGFKIYFATNFTSAYNLSGIPHKIRKDVLGIYEQEVCVRALSFVPSPHSTFSNYILRQRGEGTSTNGLIYDNIVHTSWVGHNI